jgi:hypothetical protein
MLQITYGLSQGCKIYAYHKVGNKQLKDVMVKEKLNCKGIGNSSE